MTIVASPSPGPGGPCKQQPLGTVGNDPQFPFGAWMTVKKPVKTSERTCRKLNTGLGLFFNDKCGGYPQYSLPQPASAASTAGSCLQTHLGDSSQQQLVAKVTCGSPGKISLELYACGSGAACSCSTGKAFISLQNLADSQCAQVAPANRSRPDYNPAFPQGAWMQPYRGTCVVDNVPTCQDGQDSGVPGQTCASLKKYCRGSPFSAGLMKHCPKTCGSCAGKPTHILEVGLARKE